jgi:EVE domain
MKRSRDSGPSTKQPTERSMKKIGATKKFWLAVVHKDHVLKGKEASIVMICHGKEGPLLKLKEGDLVVFYSPRVLTADKSTSNLNSFTGVARIGNTGVFKNAESMSYRAATFLECEETKIEPLVLSWKKKKDTKWGMALRSGFRELTFEDFTIISEAMKLKAEEV